MHDAALVGVTQAARDADGDAHGALGGERTLTDDHVVEARSVEQLHDQVRQRAFIVGKVDYAHDVPALQAARDLRLADEARLHGSVIGKVAPNHLHCEDAGDAGVGGPIHLTHAARRDAAEDAVAVPKDAPDERVEHIRVRLYPVFRTGPRGPKRSPANATVAHSPSLLDSAFCWVVRTTEAC